MGLDQSMGTKGLQEWKSSDGSKEEYEVINGFEWRKHARLQEFMTRLHMKKNNVEPSIVNGKQSKKAWTKVEGYIYPHQFGEMKLESSDLDELKKAIENGYKEYECDGGFFWGHEFQLETVEEYREQDLEAVETCKRMIEGGTEVFYGESW